MTTTVVSAMIGRTTVAGARDAIESVLNSARELGVPAAGPTFSHECDNFRNGACQHGAAR